MSSEQPVMESRRKDAFANEVLQRMTALRGAFSALIESLPVPIRRATDLERALGVSNTLAWQVHQAAHGPDLLAAASDMPGSGAAKRLLEAARSKGVPEERVQKAAQAIEDFESIVERHAGDRATFDVMVAGLANEADAIDLKTRRDAFRANSQVWGLQVRARLWCSLHHPGARSSWVDVGTIKGLADIRRLRHGPPFRVFTTKIADAKGQRIEHGAEASDVAAAQRPALLRAFCSQPVPETYDRVENESVITYLRETALGNTGLRTVYSGEVCRNVTWQRDGPHSHMTSSLCHQPVEAVVSDLLVYGDMFGPIEVTGRVLGSLDRLGETDGRKFGADEALPIDATVRHLGQGLAALPTVHIPRYAELVDSFCREAGWNADRFDVYRCVVEYPPLSSVITMKYPLPAKGNW